MKREIPTVNTTCIRRQTHLERRYSLNIITTNYLIWTTPIKHCSYTISLGRHDGTYRCQNCWLWYNVVVKGNSKTWV